MKVKELIKILEKMDEEALVVTSSQKYAWGCYEEIQLAESKSLVYSGSMYQIERDVDEMNDSAPTPAVVIGSKSV